MAYLVPTITVSSIQRGMSVGVAYLVPIVNCFLPAPLRGNDGLGGRSSYYSVTQHSAHIKEKTPCQINLPFGVVARQAVQL